jgi:hypothetical protein
MRQPKVHGAEMTPMQPNSSELLYHALQVTNTFQRVFDIANKPYPNRNLAEE